MKRECLFKNDFNRLVVYSLCIIVTFISFLALSPNVLAQGTYNPTLFDYDLYDYDYDVISSYPSRGWGAFLPRMDYQYSVMDYYGDQITLQGLIADPGMSTAQYVYSHMSGASLENTYTQNPYTNPALTALPARSRNMLFEFWMNTSGQTSNPGSITGIPTTTVWVPGGSSAGSGGKPKLPVKPKPPVIIWLPYSAPNLTWTTYGSVPTPDIWSPQGYSLVSGSGMGF